jgi:hypothetical protein
MKNRVNISQIIEEKYKDNNAFSAREFDELIDSVLSEGLNYYFGKVDTENLEENPQSVNISQRMHGAQGGRNEIPDEPGYGDNVDVLPQSVPDKIAETETSVTKKTETFQIEVPDIFSMITNQQMEVGDQDRKLLGRIIRNISTEKGFWRQRIEKINDFTQTASKPVDSKNIREAISSLIFLNVLKKISFFTAQPGKLFEYVIAPIIGTGAKVVGSVDKDIIDITKESQGKVWNYSVKLFTGKDSSYLVKGSKPNLKSVVESTKRPVTYIIAVAEKQKNSIEFAEFLVSTNPEHFGPEWKFIRSYTKGTVMVGNGQLGLLVINEQDFARLGYQSSDAPTQTGQQGTSPSMKFIVINNKTISLENAKEAQKKLFDSGSVLRTMKPTEQTIARYLSSQSTLTGMTGNESRFLENLGAIIEALKQINVKEVANFQFHDDTTQTIIKLRNIPDPNTKIQIYKNIMDASEQQDISLQSKIKEKLRSLSKLSPTNITEAQQDEPEDTRDPSQFSIRMSGVWDSIPNKVVLNLGDSNVYNKQQLTMASDIASNIRTSLTEFKKLNNNLINFFGTSKEYDDKHDYGGKAIENANKISANIAAFKEAESKSSSSSKDTEK